VTLCSLPPVLILPFAAKLHKERIGPRAVLAAMLAVAGTAFLYGTTPAGPPAGAPPSPR
jgi:drug/metabolite transporter (DMT)-like permease